MRFLPLSLLAAILITAPARAQSPFSPGAPTFDAAAGFDYLHTERVYACCFSAKGFNGTFAYNFSGSLAAVADFRRFSTNNVSDIGANLRLTTFLGGPRLALRRRKFTPFAQALIGVGAASSNFPSANNSSWALSSGGGVDVPIKSIFRWRVIEAEDLLTHINNGGNNRQQSLQLSTGIVFAFGRMK